MQAVWEKINKLTCETDVHIGNNNHIFLFPGLKAQI